MIVVPIYLTVDTDDESVARAVAEEFSDQPWQTMLIHGTIDYQSHLVEHRGESPVLLEQVGDKPLAKTYLPVPGLIIRRDT